MGMIRRIANLLDPERETRDDPSWAALAGGHHDYTSALAGASGAFLSGKDLRPLITPRVAENFSTVLACINAISGAIASLPTWVYENAEAGRSVDNAHAVARLIREGPNRHQSWPEFIEWLAAECLLNGNSLAEISTDSRGRVASLEPIPWGLVTPRLLNNGRIVYDVAPLAALEGRTGPTRRLLDSEVLHLRDRTDNGLIGRSRLSRTPSPVRTGLTQEAFGEFLYANQAAPSGFLSFDGTMNTASFDRAKTGIQDAWAGVRNAGKVLVVDGGAKFTPVTVTPENLEMLSARRFATEEIARMFGVPPPIIGIWDHSTFTNSETAGRWFAQFCLTPWIRKLEDGFRRQVFSAATRATHSIEFDMTGFLRGDAEARWKAHEIAVKNQILTPNEVREVEGWNPRPELDGPNVG